MPQQLLTIVFEDSDLLVINKPAGLVCHPTKGDVYSSLISRVRLYLNAASDIHLVNRLDRETSGLVLIAKNMAAASDIRRLWERHVVVKEYVAIVHGTVLDAHSIIDAPLGKDCNSAIAIKDCVCPNGAIAMTEFWTIRRFGRVEGPFSLLRVVPKSGRKHQIRIHLAHFGFPIVGDKLYGGDENCYLALVENRLSLEQKQKLILPYQALHAGRLNFNWRDQPFAFAAEPEEWFTDFLSPDKPPSFIA